MDTIGWCDGLGFIIVLTGIVYLGLIYYKVFIPYLGKTFDMYVISPLSRVFGKIYSYWIAQVVTCLVIVAALVTFIAIDSKGTKYSAITEILFYIKTKLESLYFYKDYISPFTYLFKNNFR